MNNFLEQNNMNNREVGILDKKENINLNNHVKIILRYFS